MGPHKNREREKEMKNLIVILVLLAAVAFGDIVAGSLHRQDMVVLDAAMEYSYYGIDVNCISSDGSILIGVLSGSPWTGSIDNIQYLGYAIGAVGGFTSSTSWSSDYCLIMFSDYSFMCSTSAARNFGHNVGSWSDAQISNWIDRNLIGGEI